jgi:hypothetical protein
MHVNRDRPEMVSAIGLYLDPDLVSAIGRSHRRLKDLGGMHFEAKRFDGKLSFQGSPLFAYDGEAHLAMVMQGMADDGAMVANNHTYLVREGGMKSVASADAAFKRTMDPFDLMNPGKLRFDEKAREESRGADLPSAGWRYEAATTPVHESSPT